MVAESGPSAEALSELVAPKSPEKLAALGGPAGLARALGSDPAHGLDLDEAGFAERRERYGHNRLPEPPIKSFLELVQDGLSDRTLIMLIVASCVSLVLGVMENPSSGWIEGTAILVAVVLVVMVGATNDYQKERQFRKLNAKKENKDVKVVRGGQIQAVSVFDVVVGDVLTVETGDILPADGVLLGGYGILVDESTATGESDNILKSSERDPFFLSGTQVVEGYGTFLVIAVGEHSLHGKTMMSLRVEGEDTPLQEKLDRLADQIGQVGAVMAAVTLFSLILKRIVVDYAKGLTFAEMLNGDFASSIVHYLITAITMLVVAVPEGLPLAVTMALAYSMMKMLRDNNLVRQLAACETMGNVTTICSDKTGTLTQNRMTVICGDLMSVSFDNQDYAAMSQAASTRARRILARAIAINSTAYEGTSPTGAREFLGNKTECALLSMARALGQPDYATLRTSAEVVELVPFTSARKSMATVVRDSKGHVAFVKGASERVLAQCTRILRADGSVDELDGSERARYAALIEAMAERALRTICLAFRETDEDNGDWAKFAAAELTLIGVVGIEDPVRPQAPPAVKACQEAGIMVRMVTGDNVVTARNIAKQCGILSDPSTQLVMDRDEFIRLSEDEKLNVIPRLTVLARSLPQDKKLLVGMLKRLGDVVAVTGDGTNDAPALKLAHVGFSMGIAGTEVAKEASSIILMDDNFASISKAVMWGRNVFDAIRKFLQFQLTVNLVAVALSFIGALTDDGGHSPLRPVQLLWVNLIMDTMAALALATEAPTPELLQRPPYGKESPLITRRMWKHIIGQAVFQLMVNLALLYLAPAWLGIEERSRKHLTLFFNTFVLCQVVNEVNARKLNDELNIFRGLLSNRIFLAVMAFTIVMQYIIVQFGGDFTDTTALTAHEWGICAAIALLGLPVGRLLALIPIKEYSMGPAGALSKEERSRIAKARWRGAIKNVKQGHSIVAFLRRSRHSRTGTGGSLQNLTRAAGGSKLALLAKKTD